MKFKFTCGLCKKKVKRGDKFEIQLDQYESETELHGQEGEEFICKTCSGKLERKIQALRK